MMKCNQDFLSRPNLRIWVICFALGVFLLFTAQGMAATSWCASQQHTVLAGTGYTPIFTYDEWSSVDYENTGTTEVKLYVYDEFSNLTAVITVPPGEEVSITGVEGDYVDARNSDTQGSTNGQITTFP